MGGCGICERELFKESAVLVTQDLSEGLGLHHELGGVCGGWWGGQSL